MSPLVKKLIIVASLVLVLELAVIGWMFVSSRNKPMAAAAPDISVLPSEEKVSLAETLPSELPEISIETVLRSEESEPQEVSPVEEEPEAVEEPEVPIEDPQPGEVVPEETSQVFLLHFAGDCTLGSTSSDWNSASSFVKTIGTDYSYPFEQVSEYFQNDEFTFINLEGPFTNSNASQDKLFAFKGPTSYSAILTEGSVEAVNLANNHSYDYGSVGFSDTKSALEAAGVAYVADGKTTLITTQNGLVIGLYAASLYNHCNNNDIQAIRNAAAALRSEGAELLVAAFHWGGEGKYHPSSDQKSAAHAAAGAGFDIVYGSHPHVLQETEEYNGSYILYSMGNFSFGGNTWPRDRDSAIAQFEITKNESGVSVTGFNLIPCCLSSVAGYNNYQPVPYAEGSTEYSRTMTKLNGTFTGPDLVVDYSGMTGGDDDPGDDTQPEDPAAGGTSDGSDGSDSSGTDSGSSAGSESGAGSSEPSDIGAGSTGQETPSGGETGGNSTDSGSSGGEPGDSGAGSDSGNTPEAGEAVG